VETDIETAISNFSKHVEMTSEAGYRDDIENQIGIREVYLNLKTTARKLRSLKEATEEYDIAQTDVDLNDDDAEIGANEFDEIEHAFLGELVWFYNDCPADIIQQVIFHGADQDREVIGWLIDRHGDNFLKNPIEFHFPVGRDVFNTGTRRYACLDDEQIAAPTSPAPRLTVL
jgi:hypothetical protein